MGRVKGGKVSLPALGSAAIRNTYRCQCHIYQATLYHGADGVNYY